MKKVACILMSLIFLGTTIYAVIYAYCPHGKPIPVKDYDKQLSFAQDQLLPTQANLFNDSLKDVEDDEENEE